MKELEKMDPSETYRESGKGRRCVVSKVEGPDAGKAVVECADGCTCATETRASTCSLQGTIGAKSLV